MVATASAATTAQESETSWRARPNAAQTSPAKNNGRMKRLLKTPRPTIGDGREQRPEGPAVPHELDEAPRPFVVQRVEVAQRELQVARLVPFGDKAVAEAHQPDDVQDNRHDDDPGHDGCGGPSPGKGGARHARAR